VKEQVWHLFCFNGSWTNAVVPLVQNFKQMLVLQLNDETIMLALLVKQMACSV
jgi:hypothetical protein